MGSSLRDLRRAVGRQVRDLTVLTATADGQDTYLIDNRNLVAGDDIWKGRDLYFVDGTTENLGEIRRSIASSRSDHKISWQVALPAITHMGDEVEAWNLRSRGWHPFEVNAAINDAILTADTTFNVPTYADIAGLFNQDAPLITVPAALTRVFAVEWQDEDGEWHTIDRANAPDQYGYYVNRGMGTISVNGTDLRYRMNGATLRLRGYGTLNQLTSDTDTTELHFNYVMLQAAAYLFFNGVDRNPQNERLYTPIASQAAEAKQFAYKRPEPNAQNVW